MIPVPPLPDVLLPAPWSAEPVRHARHTLETRVTGETVRGAGVRLERCAAGRLRDAYPVGLHDVEVRSDCADEVLPRLLSALTEAVGDADPRCRRIVLVTGAGDAPRIAAAESAGFRYVVDVDLGSAEHSLLTWEPDWATRVDPDLDRVPGA
jgi:hypothetical protein